MVEQHRLASTEWVDIVNEDNEVIAQSSREQMRAQRLRHRATYIVVHDGMGKILVQRRTETKDFCPACWMLPRVVLFRLMSKCLNLPAVKRKKSWALQAYRLLNTVSFILRTNTVAYGEGCLAAYPTGRACAAGRRN